METLTLFKEAGIEDILNSVKNEWSNGDFLQPMAVGGGLGGLGYGAASMLGQGDKEESSSDKTKRVLQQMLKGTALGAGAGAAYGGSKHLLKGLMGSGAEQAPEGPKESSSLRDSVSATATATAPKSPGSKGFESPNFDRGFESTKDYAGDHPVEATLTGGAVGAAGGAGTGALLGKLAPNRAVENNPDYRLGKETERLVGRDGDLMKRMHKAIEEAQKGTINLPGRGPIHQRFNIGDVTKGITESFHPSSAGESVGFLDKMLRNMPQAANHYDPGTADMLSGAARNLTGSVQPSGMPDQDLLKGLSGGGAARTTDDLSTISAMRKAIGDSELSNVGRLTRKGGLHGLVLGALGGAGLGSWDKLSEPPASNNTGRTPLTPANFRNIPTGY